MMYVPLQNASREKPARAGFVWCAGDADAAPLPAIRRARDALEASTPHEAFALAFRPGEGLFHRFALVDSAAHILVRVACA